MVNLIFIDIVDCKTKQSKRKEKLFTSYINFSRGLVPDGHKSMGQVSGEQKAKQFTGSVL